MISEFENRVYEELKKVARGRVTTYSALAKAVGKPKAARAIGNAVHKNPFAPKVPCHRVVMSDGRLGGFASGPRAKISLLKKEGVFIRNGRVVEFERILYRFGKKSKSSKKGN